MCEKTYLSTSSISMSFKIIKSLYIIFIIKHVDLTCPLAKPERSRVQSLLKLSADTDPYC